MDTHATDATIDRPTHDAPLAPASGLRWPVLLTIGLVALLVGLAAGFLLRSAQIPGSDSADAGFARDMSIHHAQAVEMATLVYDRTDDPAVRGLAYDILTTQQGQIGIMGGWLDAWGLPWTDSGPRMVWMDMPTEGLMPGMATPEQMQALRAADGEAADVIFLQLMIPHHQGGVAMAEMAAGIAGQEVVRQLADSMAQAQQYEIDYMQELLQQKGQAPLPDPMPATGDPGGHSMP